VNVSDRRRTKPSTPKADNAKTDNATGRQGAKRNLTIFGGVDSCLSLLSLLKA